MKPLYLRKNKIPLQDIIITFLSIIILVSNASVTLGSSLPFDNQQLQDFPYDQAYPRGYTCFDAFNQANLTSDIIGSSFNSNGTDLFSTIWMNEVIGTNISSNYGKMVHIYPGSILIVDVNISSEKYSTGYVSKYDIKGNIAGNERRIIVMTAIDNTEILILDLFNGKLMGTYLFDNLDNRTYPYILTLIKTHPFDFYKVTLDDRALIYLSRLPPKERERFILSNQTGNSYAIGINDSIKTISQSYSIQMDVVSVYDNQVDYRISLIWDNSTKNWINQIEEIWPYEGGIKPKPIQHSFYNDRLNTLNSTEFRDFFNINVDLESLNVRGEYKILFYTHGLIVTKKGYLCEVSDHTERVSIPLPKIDLTFIPNSLTLQGKQKGEIQVVVNSSSALNSLLYFHDKSDANEILDFFPNNISLPKKGKSISTLQIESLNYSRANRIIEVTADVIFPQRFISTGLDSSDSSINSEKITLYGYPQIIIEPPKDFWLQLSDLFDNVSLRIQNFSGVIAAILTILTTLGTIFTIIIKKNKGKGDRTNTSISEGAPF
jgi:hypothetical protein